MNGPTIAVLVSAGLVASANWWSRWRDNERLELVTKPTVTILLIVAAIVIDAHPSSARPWFVAALIACLAGDVALLHQVDRFIVGLGSFLVGHVLFAIGAIVIGVHWAWIAIPLAVIAAIAWPVVRPIVRGSRSMAVPVTVYFAVIASASTLLVLTGRPWAIAGAVAFMVSDSILGWNRFVHPLPWAPVAIMAAYHVALAALVLALM